MRAFNALCTDIALNHPDDTNRFVLQRLIYRETIKFTSLSSQFVIKAITRVAGANKTRKAQLKSKKLPRKKRPATHCSFARFSAVPYDARLLNMSSLLSAGTVSIASLTGRQKVKVCLDSRNLGVLSLGQNSRRGAARPLPQGRTLPCPGRRCSGAGEHPRRRCPWSRHGGGQHRRLLRRHGVSLRPCRERTAAIRTGTEIPAGERNEKRKTTTQENRRPRAKVPAGCQPLHI